MRKSIIVNGEDSWAAWRLVLVESDLKPPEVKTRLVDVPGGNGSIDLTEALTGDAAYGLREHSFTFASVRDGDFEATKTRLSNLLHGRRLPYRLSWDPGYEYAGRFEIDEYPRAPSVGRIVVRVSADPYKSRGRRTYHIDANGGRMYRFESGRKPVQPVIECKHPARLRFGDVSVAVGAGTWRLNDVVFRQGWNELYINSFEVRNTPWYELRADGRHPTTWAGAAGLRWDGLCALDGEGVASSRTYEDLAGTRWASLAAARWADLRFQTPIEGDYTTYLSYDWSDL